MSTMTETLAGVVRQALAPIGILPRRMLLETPGSAATVPLLRGVWGAALHDLDADAYRVVFHPQEGPGVEASPAYVCRPAPPDPRFAPALEWISIGPAVAWDTILVRAWDIASGMGLGPARRRFHVRRTLYLLPDGSTIEPGSPNLAGDRCSWSLDRVEWPFENPESFPCILDFPCPLRLRRHGQLLAQPALPDIVVAATRRVRAFLPSEHAGDWDRLARNLLELSRGIPCTPFRGERLDLRRYSASQRTELELQGVVGQLGLPAGPGPLWPLLAAAQWLHVGKSTVMGLGQLRILPSTADLET